MIFVRALSVEWTLSALLGKFGVEVHRAPRPLTIPFFSDKPDSSFRRHPRVPLPLRHSISNRGRKHNNILERSLVVRAVFG